MIAENLKKVEENIEEACKRSGRKPSDVRLIAVSKTKPCEDILEAYNAGQRAFGENWVQELVGKFEVLPSDIEWHMIGHLQRNKVKYIADKTALIHSVDSVRLAEQISSEAAKKGIVIPFLLEVNIAREATKFGFFEDEVERACNAISALPGVVVKGLMTSAPMVNDAQENRKFFRKLFKLYVDIQAKNIDNVFMDELSMGMTGDYEVAVEEGATMVRVGTGVFGSR